MYDAQEQRKTFSDAEAQCEKDTGTLAAIGDGFSEAFMEALLFYYDIRDAWIGLMKNVSCLSLLKIPIFPLKPIYEIAIT